jgi:hypothetical protein
MTKDLAEPRPRLARPARGGDTRPMEARLAKVEAGIEYLQREVAEVKADVHELRGEMHGFRDDIHREIGLLRTEFRGELHAEVGVLRKELHIGLLGGRDFALRLFPLTWASLIAAAVGLAGMMARGFHWQ